MISEENKARVGPESRNELDDVLDQIEVCSPSSPKEEYQILEKNLPKLGSGVSKKIPSLGLGVMNSQPKQEVQQKDEGKPGQKPAGVLGSLKSFFSKPKLGNVEILNDKE